MFRMPKNEQNLRRVKAYKAFFATDDGRVILKDLMNKCFVLRPVTTTDGQNISAFNDGKRAVFIDIVRECGLDEEALLTLMNERTK